MTIVVPALSEDGWVDLPVKQADYLFSHFFLSDYSQTYIYNGKVSSFAYIMQQHQSKPNVIASELSNVLQAYFGRHFKNVECECTADQDPDNANKMILRLYLAYTGNDGVRHSLGKMLNVLDSKIQSVVALSNFGEDALKSMQSLTQ